MSIFVFCYRFLFLYNNITLYDESKRKTDNLKFFEVKELIDYL